MLLSALREWDGRLECLCSQSAPVAKHDSSKKPTEGVDADGIWSVENVETCIDQVLHAEHLSFHIQVIPSRQRKFFVVEYTYKVKGIRMPKTVYRHLGVCKSDSGFLLECRDSDQRLKGKETIARGTTRQACVDAVTTLVRYIDPSKSR